MAQLSSRKYLKFTLLIVGVVNFVFGILLLASGFKIKAEFDAKEIYTKNYVEASQYWAGIPVRKLVLFFILMFNLLQYVYKCSMLVLSIIYAIVKPFSMELTCIQPMCTQLSQNILMFEAILSPISLCSRTRT